MDYRPAWTKRLSRNYKPTLPSSSRACWADRLSRSTGVCAPPCPSGGASKDSLVISSVREFSSLTALIVLQAVGVHPGHKRRGIGKQLVQVGIDAAAADGIDVWLLATPEGKLLYVSMGFEIQGEKEIAGEIQTAMWKGGEEKRNQG